MDFSNRASYQSPIAGFLATSKSEILGELTRNQRHRQVEQAQIEAWGQQIELLRRDLAQLSTGHLFLEFEIPRVGRRADAILLIGQLVVVIEFKIGAQQYDANAIDQTLDYALDLKNFHLGSHHANIVPVLVATCAPSQDHQCPTFQNGVAVTILANRDTFASVLTKIESIARIGEAKRDPLKWASSPYSPTPTIVEAAQALYQGHQVENLSRSDSGATNLSITCLRIAKVIEDAKREGTKAICFVTGVPGSGKTLAGLKVATDRMRVHEDEHAVFLSGNGPLVAVLQAALSQDELARQSGPVKLRRSDSERKAKAFIQNIHAFRDDNLKAAGAPVEKVVVFDEAQRAWNHDQTSKFMKAKRGQEAFASSEPEFLLSVMDRHRDWCVVVCLVGEGQEINTGEAGIQEWFDALSNKFSHWRAYRSSRLDRSGSNPNFTVDNALHLSVSLRSFRAEKLADFVEALLDSRADAARSLLATLPNYPICVTRSIDAARQWLRERARGTERIGLVASSNAIRLKPYGIHVKSAIEPELWFLKGKSDVRSSFQLEDAATEFDVQGLELDWVGVCWDANLRREHNLWREFRFRGTSWQNINNLADQKYMRNSYRVLLSRARQGLVIFVPIGNDGDPTCLRDLYDPIYDFLLECGIPSLQ